MPCRTLFVFLLLVALARPSGDLCAQSLWIGPTLRMQIGTPAGATRDSGIVNRFGSSGTGRSLRLAPALGLAAALDLDDWRIGLDITGVYAVESFRSDPYDVLLFDTTSARDISTRREFTLDAQSVEIEFAGRVSRRMGMWELGLGGWITPLRPFSTIEVREKMIAPTPDSITYPDGSRELLIADPAVARTPLRYGPLATLGPRFPITSTLHLSLLLEARVDLGTLRDGGTVAQSFSGGLGVALLFGTDDAAAVPPDSLRDTASPPTPPLIVRLALSVEGSDTSRALATPERERVRSVVPWPRVTGFASNSSTLPALFNRRSWARGGRLRLGVLADRSPDTIAAHALDILRLRADEHPDATVRIIGRSRDRYGLALARRRAESVQRYLVEQAGIVPARMTVEAGVSIEEEGVEIASEQPEITAPIVVEWIVRRLRAPVVVMRPMVEPRALAERWRLRIERDGRALLELAGEGAPPVDGWRERLPLYNLLSPPPLPPLEAALDVTDNAGRITAARAAIAVGVAVEDDTTLYRRERIILSLPDPGGTIAATAVHRDRALALVGSLAHAGDSVRGDAALGEELRKYLSTGVMVTGGESVMRTGWRAAVIEREVRSSER